MYTNKAVCRRALRLKPLAACLLPMLALSGPALAAVGVSPSSAQRLDIAAIGGGVASAAIWTHGKPLANNVRGTLPPHTAPSQLMSPTVTSCADDGGFDTLRHAALVANSDDIIDLGGLPCSKITLQSGAIAIAVDNLTIKGPSTGTLTIDGNAADREAAEGGKGTLSLSGLTVTNGIVATDKALGGCIYTKGSLTLTRSTLTACKAIGQTIAIGGGALAYADMTLDSSTVSGNLADATVGQPKTAALAGGVAALGHGKGLTVTDSIVSGNTVHAASGSAEGGGAGAFIVTSKYSTFTGNIAKAIGDASDYGAGGGLVSFYSLSMSNSTVDHNQADIAGGIFVGNGGGFATIIQSTISTNKGTWPAAASSRRRRCRWPTARSLSIPAARTAAAACSLPAPSRFRVR